MVLTEAAEKRLQELLREEDGARGLRLYFRGMG